MVFYGFFYRFSVFWCFEWLKPNAFHGGKLLNGFEWFLGGLDLFVFSGFQSKRYLLQIHPLKGWPLVDVLVHVVFTEVAASV